MWSVLPLCMLWLSTVTVWIACQILASVLFQRDELSANQGKKQKMQETINSKSFIQKYEVASMVRFLMLKVFYVRVILKKKNGKNIYTITY